ncbi:Hypothetical protein LLA12_01331 [Lactococcus lactis subsp. lactis]|nr:Hypothetical protein LLA12_01331 [Lactococcus lactis subsp. lactis]
MDLLMLGGLVVSFLANSGSNSLV